jgi:hypothetical protein
VDEVEIWSNRKITLNNMVDDKAVRNAVISAALIKPLGVPSVFRRVSDPVGLVAVPLISLISGVISGGTSNGVVDEWRLGLYVYGSSKERDDMDNDDREDSVGVAFPELILKASFILPELALPIFVLLLAVLGLTLLSKLLRRGGWAVFAQTSDSVTILTPIASLLFAGMKSVVLPFLRLRCVLVGW